MERCRHGCRTDAGTLRGRWTRSHIEGAPSTARRAVEQVRAGVAGHVMTGGPAGVRAWVARPERVLWATVIVVVLVMQWPMLKGRYYRATGRPLPATSTQWRTELDMALGEARRTQKQVLVDFTADWCPPCIAMQHDVWPDPAVERALAKRYVAVVIDIDRDPVVPERYGVSGIPTVLVLNDEGLVLRRASFLSASGMLRFLTDTH
jgi:thiol:disulfide interchange protein